MNHVISLLLSFLFFSSSIINAQHELWDKDFGDTDKQLSLLGDIMYNAVVPEHRKWAAEKFEELLYQKVEKDYLTGLMPFQWAQIQIPADSSFAIITWQFKNASNRYEPKGIIALKGKAPKVLSNENESWQDSEYDQFTASEWPGAVYYKMMPATKDDMEKYILFGYNGWDNINKIRVLEVLDLSEGDVTFGAPIFIVKDDPVRPDAISRKVLRYAAQSKVQINYADSSQMILYDHLIPTSTLEGQLTAVPDGSYEAFQFRGGKWFYVEKVYDQTQDTPPGEGKPSDEERDIFGKKK